MSEERSGSSGKQGQDAAAEDASPGDVAPDTDPRPAPEREALRPLADVLPPGEEGARTFAALMHALLEAWGQRAGFRYVRARDGSAQGVAPDGGVPGLEGPVTFTFARSQESAGGSATAFHVTTSLDPAYLPNTTLYNSGGILIIANEQILGGDGSALRTLTTNALRVSLSIAGVVTGSIIVGQSQAALSAVPEPGTAALLGLGLVAIAVRGRRR